MTKQEKIKDVYQKLGFIWSKIEHLVTEEGVLILPSPDLKYSLEGYENLVADKEKFSSFGKEGLKLQPSSLKGIYNNNGWIHIESEIDLPKEDCSCIVIFDNGEIDVQRFFINYKDFANTPYKYITHYQVVKLPSPPIY